ncbi:MAG: transposase [Planctomycetes bacterium]|nr:transposase [Planctomycetota bacterium]
MCPPKPGDRVKTDHRDALKLLGLFKAGLLTEVYAPNGEQEAARDLVRCRDAARINLKRIQHQVVKFLTRHGYVFTDGDHWTQKHFCWMRSLEFDVSRLRDVFDIYFTELQHCMQRLASLDKEVAALAQKSPYREIVGILRCFHGIDTLTAIDIADRAGRRLRRRYWYLINHGKMSCKANVAIARELIGFLWSVFREYELRTGVGTTGVICVHPMR